MSKEKKIIYCDECEHEFFLDSVEIQEDKVKVDENQIITLVFFTCPKCKKIYRVCLRDEEYDKLIYDLNKTKKRIRRSFGNGNLEFARTLNNMVLRKQQRLKRYEEKLLAKYSGTFVFSSSENKSEEQIVYLP